MAEWIIDDDEWVMTGGEHAVRHELIRCKDCGNQECEGHNGYIVCGITGESHPPTWFCADGEHKEVGEDNDR